MCACGRTQPADVQTSLQVEQQRLANEMNEIRAELAEERTIESARAALANAAS